MLAIPSQQNCHLDRRTLSICISMIENGVKPEALAVSHHHQTHHFITEFFSLPPLSHLHIFFFIFIYLFIYSFTNNHLICAAQATIKELRREGQEVQLQTQMQAQAHAAQHGARRTR